MRQVFQACLLLACLRYGEAILKEVDFQMENHFVFFLEMDYGLDVGATITVDLVNRKPANDTYVMILSHGQWLAWRETELVTLKSDPEQPESRSPLNAYLVSCWRGLLTDKLQGTFQVEEQTGGRNRYTVILVSALKSPVEVKGSLSLVNPGGQELSLQDRDVPKALMCLGILFFIVSTLALLPLVVRKGALQALLVVVLALRGVVLMLRWLDLRLVAGTGTEPGLVSISWALLAKVQNILELMMFLLISLGWKVLRNQLDVSEIRFAVAISIISFYLGIFQVACTTPSTCSGYQLSRYILHSLCYLVVIVAMNFNLQKLVSAIADAPASQESGKLYKKLYAYHLFRWVFLMFIIAPTVELFLKVTIIPWDAQWLFLVLKEMRGWVIYVLLIHAYRPDQAPLRVFELTDRDASSDRD